MVLERSNISGVQNLHGPCLLKRLDISAEPKLHGPKRSNISGEPKLQMASKG